MSDVLPDSDSKRAVEGDERLEIPRNSFWANLPPRALVRVASLLVILAVVIYLQARSASLADSIGRAFFPGTRPPAPAKRTAPTAVSPPLTGEHP